MFMAARHVAFAGACDWDFEPSCSDSHGSDYRQWYQMELLQNCFPDLTQDQYRWVLQHSKPPVKPVLANRCGFCNAKIDEVATCCSKAECRERKVLMDALYRDFGAFKANTQMTGSDREKPVGSSEKFEK